MNILEKLIYLTKSSTLRTLSGEPKRLYKHAIAATFFNIIRGKHLQAGQFENINIAEDVLKNPKESVHKYSLTHFKGEVQKSLRVGSFHNPDEPETIDELFSFFREKLKALKRGKRFWKASEFQSIIKLEDFFKESYGPIKEHHWIDFNIERGLVPTMPEFITYGDLINSWNLLLERWEEYEALAKEYKGVFSGLDFVKSEESRIIEYEIFALQRTCYTGCITFVESYLFYLFYNFKINREFIDDEQISDLYKTNEIKVNDTHIIEKIIIPKFVNMSEAVKIKQFKKFNKEYIEINKIRNSIIHTTAFEDRSNQSSFMELFFEIDLNKVEKAMTLSIDFVLFIEELLPQETKILFWWDRFEDPDFSSRKKLTIVNPNSNLSNLKNF